MCELRPNFGDFREVTPERDLYPLVFNYLHSDFYAVQRPRHGRVEIVAEDVSQLQVVDQGAWSRMDVAAVCIRRLRFAPVCFVETVSFEIKTRTGANLQSVHEALAHRRFAESSFLLWNRNVCTCGDQNYRLIEESCRLHGIGLITVHDPHQVHTYEIRIPAEFSIKSADAIDEFIQARFTPGAQALIENSIHRFNGRIEGLQ